MLVVVAGYEEGYGNGVFCVGAWRWSGAPRGSVQASGFAGLSCAAWPAMIAGRPANSPQASITSFKDFL